MNEENVIDKTDDTKEEKFRLRTIVSDEDIMILRKESDPVVLAMGDNSGKAFPDKDTLELIQALRTYVVEHHGLGMSAIQLGVAKRVFVMRRPYNSDNIVTMINPRLLRGEGHSVKSEGCFSIPDLPSNVIGAKVKRMSSIFVEYTDEDGILYEEDMLVGMDARIFLHELDHLNGYLCLDDRTPTGKFMGWERLV